MRIGWSFLLSVTAIFAMLCKLTSSSYFGNRLMRPAFSKFSKSSISSSSATTPSTMTPSHSSSFCLSAAAAANVDAATKLPVPFVKYQGLGNDFVIVDNTKSTSPMFTPQDAVKLCDRNFGIGGDGLIFALPGQNGCDYTMRIYNSDGSEPQMCGNGIRCMAKFLVTEVEGKALDSERTYKIWTNAGEIIPIVTKDGLIVVDMGKPILVAEKVPTILSPTTEQGWAVNSPITVAGSEYLATCVSMGNPHCVVFVPSLESMNPTFATVGPLFENNVAFPQRVNAEFVEVVSPTYVKMKVWERGAGPTLACGTGACAVVVAGVLTKRCERKCRVGLPGGDLTIEWRESDGKIYMTGPAEAVFKGTIM